MTENENKVCITKLTFHIFSRCSTGELKKLSDFYGNSIRLKNAGSVSVANAIKGRVGYFGEEEDENLYICECHRTALIKNFHTGDLCSAPASFAKHPTSEKRKSYRSVTYEETKLIKASTNELLAVGKGICTSCHEALCALVEEQKRKEKEAAQRNKQQQISATAEKRQDETGFPFRRSTIQKGMMASGDHAKSKSSDEDEDSTMDVSVSRSHGSDPEVFCLSSPEQQQQRLRPQKNILRELSRAIGIAIPQQLTKSLDDLSGRRKRDHINWRQSFDHALDRLLCPMDPLGYRQVIDKAAGMKAALTNVIPDGVESELINAIATAYFESDTAEDKRRHLSIIATALTLEDARKVIPNLTSTAYKKARRHGFYVGIGVSKTEEHGRMKFSVKSLEHFIGYICSSLVISDLPFGEKTLKLSSGETVIVPNVIRNFAPERIVKQYYAFYEEEKKDAPELINFPKLGRSAILRILQTCKASQRKCMRGLDYFTAEGSSGCETLIEIVERLEHEGQISNESKQSWIKRIKMVKDYLKGQFKAHVKLESSVVDHCIHHALSDPTQNEFAIPCCRDHDETCNQCEEITNIINVVRNAAVVNADCFQPVEKAMIEERIDEAERHIHLWKAHQLRVINQEQARTDLLESLRPGKDCVVLQDWAMKYLAQRYRETMAQFFGKRGMPWHVSVAFMKMFDGKINVRTFIHHFGQCKQGSTAVVAIMTDVLIKLKQEIPTLENAFYRSDNASCYHGAPTLLSVPAISKKTGIRIKRVDFSDPQGGKADCDRAAATIKRHINLYLAEKHDVTTPEQFFEAGESHGGVRGTSFHSGNIEASEGMAAMKGAITGIDLLNNFEFSDDGIRAWRAYKVGSGKVLKFRKNLAQVKPEDLPRFVEQFGTTREMRWRILGEVSNEKTRMRENDDTSSSSDDESENEDAESRRCGKLFSCPQDGCQKSYRFAAHLEKHLLIGKHMYGELRFKLEDAAALKYHQQLSMGVGAALRNQHVGFSWRGEDDEEAPRLSSNAGWALKTQRPIVHFTEKQKAFLKEKFQEGEQTNNKYSAEKVAELMRKTMVNGEPLFSKDEWLTRQQIFSYFSRLTAQRRLEEQEQPSNESENSGEVQDDFEIAEEGGAFEEATLLQTIRNAFQAEIEDNEEANEPSTVPKPTSRASCKIPSRIRRQRSDDSSEEEDDRPGPSQRGGKKKKSNQGSGSSSRGSSSKSHSSRGAKRGRQAQKRHGYNPEPQLLQEGLVAASKFRPGSMSRQYNFTAIRQYGSALHEIPSIPNRPPLRKEIINNTKKRNEEEDLYNLCGIAKELKAIETPKKEAHVEMILHKVDGASQNMVPRAIGMLNPVASMDKPIQAKASTPSCDQPTHVVKKNSADTKSKVIAMKPASHCTNYNPR